MENYYRLNIIGFGEYYEYGATALEAIKKTREDFATTARQIGRHPQPLGAITARKAVYKEWNCSDKNFTLNGHTAH